MTIGLFSGLLGLAILITTVCGFYLLINARSVASFFSTPSNELAPGPGRRRVPPLRLFLAMLLFAGGFVASLIIWSFAATDAVTNAVESHPEEVQRP